MGSLDALAEAVAAGSLPAEGPILALSRQALAHGFDWVMLYAALGACGFAVLSWRAFGTPPAR